MKKFFLLLLATGMLLPIHAQSLREDIAKDKQCSAGYYKLYTFDGTQETPAPAGYRPFYVSHYGRHGSRYMIDEEKYTELVDHLAPADSLGILSPLGKSVLERLRTIAADGKFRAGELSAVGARQHREIGSRLYNRYPELFAGDGEIDARSTMRVRCVLSMQSFCEALKENNPKLDITQSSSLRNSYWLEFFNKDTHDISPDLYKYWKKGLYVREKKDMLYKHVDIDGMYDQFFTSVPKVNKEKKLSFLVKLYDIGNNQKGVESDINFYDIFSNEDLYWFTVSDSYNQYSERGPNPQAGGINMYYSKLLLEDILNRAQDAVDGNGRKADLRFGHDIDLMALIPMMQINDWYMTGLDPETTGEKWQISKLTPMAANLQFVFYKNPQNEVLLKVMHNEKEVKLPVPTTQAPYYKWSDFKDFYEKHMAALPEPVTPTFYE